MKYHYPLCDPGTPVAETLVRAFQLEVRVDGAWKTVCEVNENRQRLVRIDLQGIVPNGAPIDGVRLTPRETWGSELVHIFAFDLE